MNMYSPTQKFDLEIEIEYEEVVNLFFFPFVKDENNCYRKQFCVMSCRLNYRH